MKAAHNILNRRSIRLGFALFGCIAAGCASRGPLVVYPHTGFSGLHQLVEEITPGIKASGAIKIGCVAWHLRNDDQPGVVKRLGYGFAIFNRRNWIASKSATASTVE